MITDPDDGFLSSEDLDLRTLSEEEFNAWWWRWFRAAQATNDRDEHLYSHGVFTTEPGFEHLEEQRRWQ
jgi:hypothetical protein